MGEGGDCQNRSKIQPENYRDKLYLITHIHDRHHSWFDVGTTIQRGGLELVLWAHTSPLSNGAGIELVVWAHTSPLSNGAGLN